MNREEAILTNYGATISEVISEIKVKIPRIKRFMEMADKENIERWEEKLRRHLEAIAVLCGPQPDPITGLVPCGCGGKAAVKKGANHRSGYYVICEKCECNIGLDRDDYLRPYGAYPTEEQAVSDWDTAMGYTAPPPSGAIGPEPDRTAPNGDKGAEL